MIQITRKSKVDLDKGFIHRARDEFVAKNCTVLPKLLDGELLQDVRDGVRQAKFHPRSHYGDLGVELCMDSNETVLGLLHFLVNRSSVFEVIQLVAGCEAIKCFKGRVYRMLPETGHYDGWHDDNSSHRLVALSMNLSEETYEGGATQIRKAKTKEAVCEMSNTGIGDGIIIRIDSTLQHRITRVEGSAEKTAFAGWFCSEPDYRELNAKAALDVNGT